MYSFPEVVKIPRFCLTLTGEVRLWYESLRPIVVNWQGLQNQFRQHILQLDMRTIISCLEIISL